MNSFGDSFKKIEKKEVLCLAGVFLIVFALLMDHTYVVNMDYSGTLRRIGSYTKYLAYIILCIKIMIDQFDRKKIVLSLLYLGLFLLGTIFSGENIVLFFLVYIATMGCNGKYVISASILSQSIILVCSIVAALTGMVTNYDFSSVDRKRYGMGFAWCTTSPILLYFIMLGYIYVRGKKFKWYEALVLEVINYLIYTQTTTRMTFFVATIFLLFFAIQSLWENPWRILSGLRGLWVAMPFICAAIAFVVTMMFDANSSGWVRVDDFLSGRLHLGFNAIERYGLTLFGQPIEWVGSSTLNTSTFGYNYVDCSYLQIALNYGVLALLAILTIYSIAIYRAGKADDYWLVFVLIFVLIHSLTEPRLYNFAFNTLSFAAFAKLGRTENEVCDKNDILYNSGTQCS